MQRAIDWVFAMQCKNGGWASFDKDNTKMIFQYIPFADHNAMLDPPTVDITGRVLEMLARYGYTRERQARQEGDPVHPERAGAGRQLVWPLGRELPLWHVAGAARIGGDGRGPHEPACSRRRSGCAWCRMLTAAGARRCGTYDDPPLARHGPSTASQTAWAVMGLLAAGDTRSEPCSAASSTCCERNGRMATGTKTSTPGRASRSFT